MKKRMSALERLVAKVRKDHKAHCGHNLTLKYRAWVSGNVIKVKEFDNDSDEDMLRVEYEFAL